MNKPKVRQETLKKLRKVFRYLQRKEAKNRSTAIKKYVIIEETEVTSYILKKGEELGLWKKMWNKGFVFYITKNGKFLQSQKKRKEYLDKKKSEFPHIFTENFEGTYSDIEFYNETIQKLEKNGRKIKGLNKIEIKAQSSKYWTTKTKIGF